MCRTPLAMGWKRTGAMCTLPSTVASSAIAWANSKYCVAWTSENGIDVAQAVARVVVGSPLNGRVEVAGPEQFRMDEFFRMALAAWDDPREVVTDPQARYFGSVPGERTLVPGDGATLGQIRYRDWLDRAATGK
jgi:uncharacterized protein YbjT (DUF2867 family)